MTDSGADRIAVERARQIAEEGWTPEHDDEHVDGGMTLAAVIYIEAAFYADAFGKALPFDQIQGYWPWGEQWWKPSTDPVRNLEKAGALVAAEIDRHLRMSS